MSDKLALNYPGPLNPLLPWPNSQVVDYQRLFERAYAIEPTYHAESMLGAITLGVMAEQVECVRLVHFQHHMEPGPGTPGIPRGGKVFALRVGDVYLYTDGPRALAELTNLARGRALSWALDQPYIHHAEVSEDGRGWKHIGRVGERVEGAIRAVVREEKILRARELLDEGSVRPKRNGRNGTRL